MSFGSLATKFSRNISMLRQDSPLTNEQLLGVASSIFAINKHESRSKNYSYIPTIDIIDKLRKEGFEPFMATQSKSRIEGKKEFTKHMLRLRHRNEIVSSEAKEIILINSHDGTSSYQMMAGIYRSVCQNGMISGHTMSDTRIRHSGDIANNVIEAAYTVLDNFDSVEESIDNMKNTQLLLPESRIFANAALTLKYDDNNIPISPDKLLSYKRREDDKNDLWTTLNKVQENLIKGGQIGRNKDNKRVTTRAVNSIDNSVKINRALWLLADEMAKLKK